MKRYLFLTLAVLLCTLSASAYDFMVDGIAYNKNDDGKSVYVTTGGAYTGDIVIPEHVAYGDRLYTVTSIGGRAFNCCKGLSSVTIGNSVTSIGMYAFNLCGGLTSVTIPNSVTLIDSCAFDDCTSLASVTTPNSVTKIGGSAFGRCTCLTSVTIPNSVTEIGRWVFAGCTGLTSVTIPSSVTEIDKGAFNGCTGLTSVTIGSSVTKLGEYAFEGCTGLTSVTIGNSVSEIVSSAFNGCTGLTSVTIGSSVTEIGEYAFNGCISLTSFSLPNSVTKLGQRAFCGCTGLTSVTIGNSVSEIGSSAFFGCTGLTSVTIPTSVIQIGGGAFQCCRGLTSISIPSSVTEIGYATFDSCTGLTSVTIPNSVTEIGGSAFNGCTGLTSVSIPTSVTKLGDEAFNGCTGLTSVSLPNSVTKLGQRAFCGCTGLNSVTIGNSVTEIGSSAFEGTPWFNNQPDGVFYIGNIAYKFKGQMASGTAINIKEGTVSISDEAFGGCRGLTSVTIPNTVTKIGVAAFVFCTGLTSITIPNSVTKICSSAFRNCTGLTSIIIGNSVPEIGGSAFDGTLWYDNQPDGVVYLGKVAYRFKGEIASGTPIVIKEGTVSINSQAFNGCTGLTSVTLPNSVTRIGYEAFWGCRGLTSVTIPNSVTSIGELAFGGCSGLKKVYSLNPVPPVIRRSAFTYCDADLFVPQGSLSAYKSAKGWSEFSNIKEFQVTVKAESISLNKQSANLMIGDTLSLTAKVLPENASTKTVVWSSNNPDVASVNDEGLVTALTTGTAIISATTTDGTVLSDSATIVVSTPISAPSLSVGNYICVNGDIVTVALSLANKQEIGGFQTDFTVPEGFTVALNSKGKYDITLNADRCVDHVVTTNKLSDGSIRVLAYSPSAEPFIGESGEICYIKLVADEDVKEGDHQLIFREILISESNGKGHRCDDLTSVLSTMPVILGDVNNDHKVNVQDVLLTANVSVGKDVDGFVFRAADVNKDGIINVSDVLLVANIAVGNSVTVSAAPRFGESHDVLHVSDFMLNPGEECAVDVMLDNTVDFSALQMNLRLPAGVNLKKVALTGRATDGHAVVYNENTPGNINLMAFAASTENFTGNDGAILKLTLQADKNFSGEGAIELTDVKLAESDGYTREADDASARISAVTTGVEGVYSGVCAYAEGQSIVVEATDAGKAQIVRPNGVMQEVKVNVGRNTYPMADGGIYFICFAGKTFKVII